MLLVVVLVLGLFFAGYEASRPGLRQIMPTLVLASLAAAGRILFAAVPDFKPVSAIAIIAGAVLTIDPGLSTDAIGIAVILAAAVLNRRSTTQRQRAQGSAAGAD